MLARGGDDFGAPTPAGFHAQRAATPGRPAPVPRANGAPARRSAKTVERWEERDALPASGQVRSRLAQLRQIADLGLTVYTPDGFPRYLMTPLPTFGGRTALQLIEQGEGDRVLAALAADYEGLGF
jgi:hypothetical protein